MLLNNVQKETCRNRVKHNKQLLPQQKKISKVSATWCFMQKRKLPLLNFLYKFLYKLNQNWKVERKTKCWIFRFHHLLHSFLSMESEQTSMDKRFPFQNRSRCIRWGEKISPICLLYRTICHRTITFSSRLQISAVGRTLAPRLRKVWC